MKFQSTPPATASRSPDTLHQEMPIITGKIKSPDNTVMPLCFIILVSCLMEPVLVC